ncbi:MAG: hypothetical protein J6R01_05990 [Alistipes sp.]|nr:hypothetical protein [Alistipes sp.]
MKKLLALALVVFGLAACQTEPEGLDVNAGGVVDTTITVSLPETTRATNSAEGAFKNVDLSAYTIRYILQVYYNGTPSQERLVKYSDTNNVAFNVRLVPDRHYNFVVWADLVEGNDFQENEWSNEDGLHYNTTDLHNITLKQTWVAMDETRDAFTGHFDTAVDGDKTTYNSAKSINITLTRPFAKLRVITTDMVELGNLGIAPYKGTVTYSTKHRASFNACNGNYGEQTKENVSFTYNIASYNDNNEQNKVLFTDYFFAQNDVVKFTMDIMEANGTRIKENAFTTDIPVKRNHLTTIMGNVLTDGNNIKVTVDEKFAGEFTPEAKWDGKSIVEPTQDANGNYIIDQPSKLAWLAAAVNGTLTRSTVAADNFAGKTFVLEQDIDLGGEAWTPIGNTNNAFKGTFDGQKHTIYNLVVRGGNENNKGLFGFTTDGEIKNFTVENAKVSGRLNVGVVAGQPYTSKYSDIKIQGHVEVNGMAYVGGVGGKNAYANWTNITVDVDETSYVKANSIENGTAYRTYVGGVVGFNGEGGHKFSNISSNINVQGSTCDVGGLFGIAHYGNQFENCVCSGDVEIYAAEESAEAEEIGGIAGVWNNGGEAVEMKNIKFEGEIETNIERANVWYGGLVGKPYSATGTGKLIIDGYEMVANGVGVKENEYLVMSAQGLAWVEAQEDKYFAGKTIKLANDIDMTGVTIEKPIHFWNGRTTFDGQNYTISNLTMSTTSTEKKPFGLFGGTADIKNVKFDNANISGYSYVAVVAGNLYGNIENCHVSNSSVTCTYWMAGAMSGQYNAGNVTNCSVTNTTITGPAAVGALVGNINETAGERKVENCTVTGCTVAQNGSFGGDYDKMFGTAVGLININNSKVYINGCKVEDTTVKGATSANIFGLNGGDNTTIYVDDYTYTPDGIIKDENDNLIVNSLETLEAALKTAGAAGAGDTTIVFAENAQLNMTGAEWTPIKVDGYHGADIVTIEGNDAVITGLTAPLFAGGFAGGSGIVIKDLTIKDSAIVSANTLGSGAFIESVDSMAKIELTNCHLLNSTVTGGAGSRTGGLLGWTAGYSNTNDGPVKTYVTIDGCSVIGCTVTCDGSVGGINGHAGNNDWTYTTIKNCTIKNNTLASTDDGAWRVGVVVGTANVGEVTISNITESGNTLTQTGKTAPVGFLRNLYGRAVLGATGKLTIDGYKYVAEGLFEDANGNAVVGTQTALADALAAGKTNVTLTAGSYELYGLNFVANNVTLKGADKANVVLNLENSIYLQNKSVTLENLTYNLNAGKDYTEQAFAFVHHATAFNLKNCNVNRLRLNVYEANIEDCTFTLNTSSGFDGYCIYYYGNDNSTVNVKNSTFATAGKGICIYSEHAKAYNLNVDKCSFTSSDSATDKAAIQMHTELGISGNVKITETTAAGFANINGGLWNELNNNTKVATDKFDIWVDGTQVH